MPKDYISLSPKWEATTIIPVWSCVFCHNSFTGYYNENDIENPFWPQNAVIEDVYSHMYVEIKDYMLQEGIWPDDRKAFYPISEAKGDMLKYIDDYDRFKQFCLNRALALILLSIGDEE